MAAATRPDAAEDGLGWVRVHRGCVLEVGFNVVVSPTNYYGFVDGDPDAPHVSLRN